MEWRVVVNKVSERKRNRRRGRVHCVIYTRKSSEEGLEQDFNSLDAQREACEAFIKSQRQEGWEPLSKLYDDAGFSAGTMDRPALKRLLSDIESGRIDVVVVYKVDRLTRSLSDFAKIVDTFDAHGVSFISVTQQFNTTSSMGRLTLNMLLSFAQFEREVTGERIRDKIAASKKKGMWMGGRVPLGYDAADRKLIINQKGAETVRHIFQRYTQLGSLRCLKEELDVQGIVSKVRETRSGRCFGGKPISPGALCKILRNPIYIGEIAHKGHRYPGEHHPIVVRELWDKVQELMATNRINRKIGKGAKSPSLLAGLLYDAHDDRMSPSHAVKKGRRYRYYVSQSLITNHKASIPGGLRIPASDIERIVMKRLRAFLFSRAEVFEAIEPYTRAGGEQKRLLDQAASLSKNWLDFSQAEARILLLALIPRIEVYPCKVDIHVLPARVLDVLEGRYVNLHPTHEGSQRDAHLILSVAAHLKRKGMEMKMVIDGANAPGSMNSPDPGLVKLIVRAHTLRGKLVNGGGVSLREVARREKLEGSYVTRLLRLTFLAPDITKAILEGSQPPDLTTARLIRDTRFSMDWREQREMLGFEGSGRKQNAKPPRSLIL
jgi:DNA invertase Pin-like site-specific DNA recombinase